MEMVNAYLDRDSPFIFIFLGICLIPRARQAQIRPSSRDARPAKSKPSPAPQKLTKPAGRNGAKLTVDYTDYAHTFGLRVGK